MRGVSYPCMGVNWHVAEMGVCVGPYHCALGNIPAQDCPVSRPISLCFMGQLREMLFKNDASEIPPWGDFYCGCLSPLPCRFRGRAAAGVGLMWDTEIYII